MDNEQIELKLSTLEEFKNLEQRIKRKGQAAVRRYAATPGKKQVISTKQMKAIRR